MENREIDTTMTPILSKYQYQKPKDFGVYAERCYPVSAVMDMLKEYSDQQNKQLLDEIKRLERVICEKYDSLIVVKNNKIAKLQSELKDKESVISDLKQAMIRSKDLNDKLKFD